MVATRSQTASQRASEAGSVRDDDFGDFPGEEEEEHYYDLEEEEGSDYEGAAEPSNAGTQAAGSQAQSANQDYGSDAGSQVLGRMGRHGNLNLIGQHGRTPVNRRGNGARRQTALTAREGIMEVRIRSLHDTVRTLLQGQKRLRDEMQEIRNGGQDGHARAPALSEAARPMTAAQLVRKFMIHASEVFAWKSFKPTAVMWFGLLSAPFSNAAFVTFCRRGHTDLRRVPPLHWRFRIMTEDEMFRPYWAQVVEFVEKKIAQLDVMGVFLLAELAALFCVITRGTDILPLVAYVALARKDVSSVVAMCEQEIRALRCHSYITARTLTAVDGLEWPSGLPESIKTGEGISSIEQYLKEVANARRVDATKSEATAAIGHGTTATPVRAERPQPRPGALASKSKSNGGASPVGRASPKKVDTSNVCSRCIMRGHRFVECVYAAHALFNPHAPFELINKVGRGEVPIAEEGLKN